MVRHRRTQPFTYQLEHDVFYFALDLAELDEVAGPIAARRPQPAGDRRLPRRRPPARRPRRTSTRTSAPTSAPRGTILPAGGSRSSPTCGSWATCSTRPASTSAATRAGAAGRDRRGAQHVRRAPPVHARAGRRGRTNRRAFGASMPKAFFVSPFISRRWALRGPRSRRRGRRPHRHRPAPGRRGPAVHQPRPAAAARSPTARSCACCCATRS